MNVRTYIKLPVYLQRMLLGLGLVCTCFALVSAVQLKREAVVTQTRVEFKNPSPREHMMSSDDAYGILQQYFGGSLEGVPVRHVETDLVEGLIENHDYVLRANVYVDKLSVMHVDIVEKVPLARVFKADSSFYIDKYGGRLHLSDNYTARVPLLMGKLPGGERSPNWKTHADFILALQADEFTRALVDQILVDAEGNYEIIPLLGDHRIKFGKPDRFDTKVKNLKLFYSNAVKREGWRRCAAIDLRYDGQVVCKMNSRT